jgi:L-ascorbate metabolism protein UlaG (beta-lactamase superfamily)
MDPRDAAELCGTLQPRYAVPIHYAFTGGPLMDSLFLKYAGSPSALTQQFQQATASLTPKTAVRVLAPGEPLVIEAA